MNTIVTITLDPEIYSEQMIKKYGTEVECEIISMNGYYQGCDVGQIFYQGLIKEDKQPIYIPSRRLIKQNIIKENKNNNLITFKYNNKQYKGYYHIHENKTYFIGLDNLLYEGEVIC